MSRTSWAFPQLTSNQVHPRLFGYVEGFRNHLAVLKGAESNLLATKAVLFLRAVQGKGGPILLINRNPKLSALVTHTARHLGQPYANEYWIPGVLTNWTQFTPTLRAFQACAKVFGPFLAATRLVVPKYTKQRKKLEGLVGLRTLPSALLLFQLGGNEAIVREAQALHIPLVVLTDCTGPLQGVEYPVPLNTESVDVVYTFCQMLCPPTTKGEGSSVDPMLRPATTE